MHAVVSNEVVGLDASLEASLDYVFVELTLDFTHVDLIVPKLRCISSHPLYFLQGLFFFPYSVDQLLSSCFFCRILLGKDDHIPEDVGVGVSFADDCHHTRGEVELILGLVGAEECLPSNKHEVVSKSKHASTGHCSSTY